MAAQMVIAKNNLDIRMVSLEFVGDWLQREDNLRLNFGFAVIISGQLLSH